MEGEKWDAVVYYQRALSSAHEYAWHYLPIILQSYIYLILIPVIYYIGVYLTVWIGI